MNADPKWLDEAIEATRVAICEPDEDWPTNAFCAEDAIRAALPVIREGLAKRYKEEW